MLLIINPTAARVLARYTHWSGDQAATDRALAITAANHGLAPEDLTAHTVDDPDQAQALDQVDLADIQVTIESGQVTSVSPTPAPVTLYLHVAISGQGGTYQGVPLFAPGDSMSVKVALRAGTDPDSTVAPISGTWPVPIVSDDGSEYDRVFVTTTDGQASFTYPIPDRTGKCALSEQGMDRIAYGGAVYQIRLAQPVQFFVGHTVGASG